VPIAEITDSAGIEFGPLVVADVLATQALRAEGRRELLTVADIVL
jgi:hypothetical protein